MKMGRRWLHHVGRTTAITGAVGIVGLAAALTATTVLAWSPSDYSVSTATYTSSGGAGTLSQQVAPGQSIYDTAVVTSTFEYVQSGTLDFYLYQGALPPNCANFLYSGTGALETYAVPVADTDTGNNSGALTESLSSLNTATPNTGYQIPADATEGQAYYWVAVYNDGQQTLQQNSGCNTEPVTVQVPLSVTTTPSPSSTAVGNTVGDSAAVSGFTAYTGASGSVVFTLYYGASCSGSPVFTSAPISLSSGGTAATAPGGPTVSAVGEYQWMASVTVDPAGGSPIDLNSTCGSEPIWSTKYGPTISTVQVTPITTSQNNTISDTAILSNFYANPTSSLPGANGSVLFGIFGPAASDQCICPCSQNTNLVPHGYGSANVMDVDGQYEAIFTDSLSQPLAPGDYYWEALYSGDAYNLPAAATCGEQTVVVASTPTVSTTPSSGGVIGATLTDTAIITPVITPADPSDPTSGPVTNGTPDSVRFELFLNDPTCSVAADMTNDFGSLYATPTVNANGSDTYTISVLPGYGYTTVASGTYYWDAIFTGDSFNNSVSLCGEPVSVTAGTGGGVLAASTTTPITGADMFGPGLVGAIAMLLGGMLLVAGRRVIRVKPR
jgi:hypothetical protein